MRTRREGGLTGGVPATWSILRNCVKKRMGPVDEVGALTHADPTISVCHCTVDTPERKGEGWPRDLAEDQQQGTSSRVQHHA